MIIRVSGYQKIRSQDIWRAEYQADGGKAGDFFATEDAEGTEFSEKWWAVPTLPG